LPAVAGVKAAVAEKEARREQTLQGGSYEEGALHCMRLRLSDDPRSEHGSTDLIPRSRFSNSLISEERKR